MVVSVLPNKMIRVVGEHADYPIEQLGPSIQLWSYASWGSWNLPFGLKEIFLFRSSVTNMTILGSASHDHTVKLWDVKYLLEDDDNEVEEEKEEEVAGSSSSLDAQVENVPTTPVSMEVDSDQETDNEKSGSKKKKNGKQSVGKGKKDSNFFDDLL